MQSGLSYRFFNTMGTRSFAVSFPLQKWEHIPRVRSIQFYSGRQELSHWIPLCSNEGRDVCTHASFHGDMMELFPSIS